MFKIKYFLLLLIFSVSNVYAGNLFDKLVDAAEEAIEEKAGDKIDDLTGKYKGKISELVLIERRGNIVVFDVKFDGIKSTDGIAISRETLSGGEIVAGFADAPISVSEKKGTMRLAIKYKAGTEDEEDDDGWGSDDEDEDSAGEVVSDQIRLSLVRDSNPEKPFGALVFDMSKVWTSSNELDQPPAADDDSITLADDSSDSGNDSNNNESTNKKPAPFIKPGAVLRPVQVKPMLVKPAQVKPKKVRTRRREHSRASIIVVNKSYDLYANALKADWKGSKGKASINPKKNDRNGFIRVLPKGKLSTGNAANNLLNTYPEMRRNGQIRGDYPVMKLGSNIHFKTVIGFLHGAKSKDGVSFYVYIEEQDVKKNRMKKVLSKKLMPNKYENIDIDLSQYAGKKIKVIMRTAAGRDFTHDFAVWVAPRLEVVK